MRLILLILSIQVLGNIQTLKIFQNSKNKHNLVKLFKVCMHFK